MVIRRQRGRKPRIQFFRELGDAWNKKILLALDAVAEQLASNEKRAINSGESRRLPTPSRGGADSISIAASRSTLNDGDCQTNSTHYNPHAQQPTENGTDER
ncbi:MAG: hypothetical protein WA708_12405 [Acidobacteriaceae bacterium]